MKTCPACRKTIHVRAVKCPHCHSVFDGMQMESGRREHGRRRVGKILLMTVLVIGLIYAVMDWLSRPGTIEGMAEAAAHRQFEK